MFVIGDGGKGEGRRIDLPPPTGRGLVAFGRLGDVLYPLIAMFIAGVACTFPAASLENVVTSFADQRKHHDKLQLEGGTQRSSQRFSWGTPCEGHYGSISLSRGSWMDAEAQGDISRRHGTVGVVLDDKLRRLSMDPP